MDFTEILLDMRCISRKYISVLGGLIKSASLEGLLSATGKKPGFEVIQQREEH
jgi:hypothetical protein